MNMIIAFLHGSPYSLTLPGLQLKSRKTKMRLSCLPAHILCTQHIFCGHLTSESAVTFSSQMLGEKLSMKKKKRNKNKTFPNDLDNESVFNVSCSLAKRACNYPFLGKMNNKRSAEPLIGIKMRYSEIICLQKWAMSCHRATLLRQFGKSMGMNCNKHTRKCLHTQREEQFH